MKLYFRLFIYLVASAPLRPAQHLNVQKKLEATHSCYCLYNVLGVSL